MAGDTSQAITAFALAAIPGVIVLEILEYARPGARERSGPRAFAGYLIISLLVWIAAILCFDVEGRLAAVIDTGGNSGRAQVDACIALAWRLLFASVAVGFFLRVSSTLLGRLAVVVEERRSFGGSGV
jgi:hypothetical protein